MADNNIGSPPKLADTKSNCALNSNSVERVKFGEFESWNFAFDFCLDTAEDGLINDCVLFPPRRVVDSIAAQALQQHLQRQVQQETKEARAATDEDTVSSTMTSAPAPPQRRLLHKDRFGYGFGFAKTQSYHDPAARGPGSHTYVF